MSEERKLALHCPMPERSRQRIEMAHGGGGRAMRELIQQHIRPAFRSELLDAETDAAVFPSPGSKLAFTTDTYVVQPLFFAGADIGKLAVCGTINDLATAGAEPRYLSVGLILEEGLELATLDRVLASISATAELAGVRIATGDTKVIERARGDGIYINTAGVGVVPAGLELSPSAVQPGDTIILSGDVGRHGVAVMVAREDIYGLHSAVESDCAPLAELVGTLVAQDLQIRCLRDLTRGGLGAALHEVAAHRGLGLRIREPDVPVIDPVHGACELLGLDPLFVANEGRLVAFVAPSDAEAALEVLRSHPEGVGAAIIGEVHEDHPGLVSVMGSLGTERVLDLPLGEQLPRIC